MIFDSGKVARDIKAYEGDIQFETTDMFKIGELFMEAIASRESHDVTMPRFLARVYELGIRRGHTVIGVIK